MQYRFGFDGNQVKILVGGLLLASALLFTAGILVGLSLVTPEGIKALKMAGQAAAEQVSGKLAEQAAAAAEQVTGKIADQATERLAATLPKGMLPGAKDKKSAKKGEAGGQAAAAKATTPELAQPKPAVAAVPTVALPPAPAAPATLAQAATPAPLLTTGDSPPEEDVYSLQLGAFTDPKAARQLQTDLRERGYRAEIFSAADADQKEWHAVRIGGFATLDKASAAAAGFTAKERLQALVRRSNAL